MKISAARLAAFDILHRIEADRAFSSVLLPLYEEKLSPADRALCHELVLGTLRKQMYLDRIIDILAPSKKLDVAVRIALRLGAYQLLFLDKVPAYSAINESVNLVQKARKTSAKGFVNALLRKISAGPPELEYTDVVERLSVETSHPRWLIDKWTEDFGTDEAAQIATANNYIPRPAFRLTQKGIEAGKEFGGEKSEFVDGCYIAGSIDRALRDAADAGEIYFQDEASQLVAKAAGANLGDAFLDVCAAPGGKTTQIAVGRQEKVLFIAGDLHPSRVSLLKATCRRQLSDLVNIVQYDAQIALPFAESTFATVLVDAPCSGTGTIRHNPEVRYFIASEDLAGLANKQLAILRNASKLVRPGGRLIYSTCSLQIEENEAVCEEFQNGAVGLTQVEPDVPQRFLTGDGFARTFPSRDEMDGFFIAEFRRARL